MKTTFYCKLPLREIVKIIKNIYGNSIFDEYAAGNSVETIMLGHYYIRISRWVVFFIVLHEENEKTIIHISIGINSVKKTISPELLFTPRITLGNIITDIGVTYDFFKPFAEEIVDYVEF